MKKTIKKDMERISIYRSFINDNTLLECILDEDEKISIVVRFVDNLVNGIKEHCLARVGKDAYFDYINNFIEINDEADTIALFVPSKDGNMELDRLYDAVGHHFADSEFMDLVYKNKFKKPHEKQFAKKK